MISPSAVHAVTSRQSGSDARSTRSEWYRVASNGEGMARKTPAPVVVDGRGLSVHQALGADDSPAERLPDRLMPEAHAEDGQDGAELSHELERNACFVRRARAGRDEHAIHLTRSNAGHVDGVVLHDLDLRAELAQVLDEVERERVVVVDDEDVQAHEPGRQRAHHYRARARRGGEGGTCGHDHAEHTPGVANWVNPSLTQASEALIGRSGRYLTLSAAEPLAAVRSPR